VEEAEIGCFIQKGYTRNYRLKVINNKRKNVGQSGAKWIFFFILAV
jgi:hypothetical protein